MRRYQVEFDLDGKSKMMIVECMGAQDFEDECAKVCPDGKVKSYKNIAKMHDVVFRVGNGPMGLRTVSVFAENGDEAVNAAYAEHPEYAGMRVEHITPTAENTMPVVKRGPGRPKSEAA